MALEKRRWTSADQEEAIRDGWMLAKAESGKLEIQRVDGDPVLDCDESARVHVKQLGTYGLGCPMCKKALALVGAPAEMAKLRTDSGPVSSEQAR